MTAIQGSSLLAMTVGVACLCAQALAADPPPLAPIPAECAAATAAEGVQAIAFPNIVRAMTERQRIVALTIGGAAVGRTQRGGDYYDLVERFLESTFKGLDVVLVQRGVSGELARDGANRIRLEAARTAPDVVFWQVGTADALAGLDPAETGEVVRGVVRWLKDHHIDVVLIGILYTPNMRDDPQYQAMRKMINDVARAEGVLRIRRYEVGETLERLHNVPTQFGAVADLNAMGNACMAEYLARALATGLFAQRPKFDADKAPTGVR